MNKIINAQLVYLDWNLKFLKSNVTLISGSYMKGFLVSSIFNAALQFRCTGEMLPVKIFQHLFCPDQKTNEGV